MINYKMIHGSDKTLGLSLNDILMIAGKARRVTIRLHSQIIKKSTAVAAINAAPRGRAVSSMSNFG